MLPIIRRPQVIIDLIELADYIAEDNPEMAERFLDAFEATLAKLAHVPKLGVVRKFPQTEFKQARMWFVQGFEHYLIFYLVVNNTLEIIRVLHSSRDIQDAMEQSQ